MVQKTNLTSRKKGKELPVYVRRAVENYIDLLRKDKIPLKRAIVFGSQAKGTAHQWSDIDICLISTKFKDAFSVWSYLALKAAEAGGRIEPHPFHPDDFVSEDPLVWEIKQNGIEVKG